MFLFRISLLILSFYSFPANQKIEEDNQKKDISFECSSEDFKIEGLTVFQSVESPKLHPHNKYDLVKGKTAVALVDIKNNLLDKTDDLKIDHEDFFVSLNIIDNTRNLIYSDYSDCLEFIYAEEEYNPNDSSFCFFTKEELENKKSFQRLLLIPTDLKTGKDFMAEISLKYKNEVCSYKEFYFRMHNTRPLTLGFTGLDGSKCQSGLITDYEEILDLQHSAEVTSYIPNMFPVSDYLATLTRNDNFFIHPESFSFLTADCSKEGFLFGVGGMIQDIRKAMEKRNRIGVEKLVLVVPEDYFEYHKIKGNIKDNIKGIKGMVIRKAKKYKFFGISFGSVPGHHIAFVRERYDYFRSMKNKGVLSHEIGHTLGQEVEFYEKDTNNDGLADTFEYCKEIWGGSNQTCTEHKILRAFSNVENYRGIIISKNTIMSNREENNFNWMRSKWIDRNTYYKSFHYLKKPDTDQEESLIWLDRLFKFRQDIVTFSGLYIPEKQEFVLVPDEYYPTVEGSRNGFVSEDYDIGDLLIEYKKGDRIISKRKFITDMRIEFLKSDDEKNTAGGQVMTLDIVPVVVSLPVNEHYGDDDKELIVSLIDEQGNKLKELFREYVYKWQ